MIPITRATSQPVYATTKEKELLTSPSYVLKFVSDDGKNKRYCLCTDSSSYPDREQKFTVVETTTPTAVSNQIKLDMSKSWRYYVYEISASAAAALTTLVDADTILSLTLVEQGKARVRGTSTARKEYTGYQTTYKIYNG